MPHAVSEILNIVAFGLRVSLYLGAEYEKELLYLCSPDS